LLTFLLSPRQLPERAYSQMIPLNELAANGRRRQPSKRRKILPSPFTVLLSPRQLPERAYSRMIPLNELAAKGRRRQPSKGRKMSAPFLLFFCRRDNCPNGPIAEDSAQ
jgi:hypothetical protein